MFKNRLFLSLILCLCLGLPVLSADCLRFSIKETSGKGPLPYNYHIIDGHIHAGGHPLNPITNFSNNDQQVLDILDTLKLQGATTVIDLENTGRIQKRYAHLLKKAGIKRIHIPMHSSKVPTETEWEVIKEAMKEPVYIHCKWGADRTGAIIGRYLVEEKGFTPQQAYQAVVSKGSHAGLWGGLKKSEAYLNLKTFILEANSGK